jgi:hypothetical protein
MTLALHGKSRQRQLLLMLLAVVAVGAAVLGGTVVQRADKAGAVTEVTVNAHKIVCPDAPRRRHSSTPTTRANS